MARIPVLVFDAIAIFVLEILDELIQDHQIRDHSDKGDLCFIILIHPLFINTYIIIKYVGSTSTTNTYEPSNIQRKMQGLFLSIYSIKLQTYSSKFICLFFSFFFLTSLIISGSKARI